MGEQWARSAVGRATPGATLHKCRCTSGGPHDLYGINQEIKSDDMDLVVFCGELWPVVFVHVDMFADERCGGSGDSGRVFAHVLYEAHTAAAAGGPRGPGW